MDLTIIILGVIFTIICALPFILTTRARSKKNIGLLCNLQRLASSENYQITKFELNGSYAIGIDETNKVCVFYKQGSQKLIEELINLADVKLVEWQKTDKFNDTKTASTIDKLDLKFISKNNKPTIILPFFDLQDEQALSDEFISMKKWQNVISTLIDLR